MDRSQGTTLGAILIAALLFRTGVQRSPEPKAEDLPAAVTASSISTVGEGPWTASCRYWAPDNRDLSRPVETAEVDTVDIKHTGDSHEYHLTVKDSSKGTGCNEATNIWGIPDKTELSEGDVLPSGEAIIAIVPDPVITSLPLQFDRYIDALIDAASQRPQHYQGSYFWLPWQSTHFHGQHNEDSVSWEEKSKEPGLLILRKVYPRGKINGPDVLYIFLVGETPTSGIDGEQMQLALKHRQELQQLFGHDPKKPDILRVIGPTLSGSAASLERALKHQCAMIRGTTSTDVAVEYLNTPNNCDSVPDARYQSFGENNADSREKFIASLVQSGIAPNQISVMVEEGTTLGFASGQRKSSDVPKSSPPEYCEPNSSGCYNVIQFPRNIFMLRNAYEQRNAKPQDLPPSPYLQLKLGGSTPSDAIPDFDQQKMPLSEEAQLMAIQHQLLRYHTKYILIWGSSNILDEIFLAQYFHRALPDARLAFIGSDLLVERETENTTLIGSLTVTPYHLIGLGNPNNPGFGGFAFPDSDSDRYYNAATDILCQMTGDCKAEDFAAYKPPLVSPLKGTLVSPPLWVTVTGADGYYPLGILEANHNPKRNDTFLPGIPLQNNAAASRFPLHPSPLWFFCA